MSSRYMMATKATHTLGDISRDEPDLAIIDREVGDDYIGEWVTGIGYVGVRFPKATTRALTEDEKAYYRTKVVETPWGSWLIDPDEPPGYAGDVLKDTWQGEPRPTVEPVTVKLDNRDATFTPTGPAHFPAQPATAVVGGSEPAGETTGQDGCLTVATDPFGAPCTCRCHTRSELVEPDPTHACPRCGTTWTAEIDDCPQCKNGQTE